MDEPEHWERLGSTARASGKDAKYTGDALAHVRKTIDRSPHRLPSCGNPGILLYANDMTSASALAGEALGAVAASTQRHGWCSESHSGLRGTVPIIRFRIGPKLTRLTYVQGLCYLSS